MSFCEGDLSILHVGKHWVERGDLASLQDAWQSFQEGPDIPTLFHRIYLHACLKKQPAIADWLETVVFPTLCPIQQIGLRHIFAYGHTLLNQKVNRDHGRIEW